MDGATREAREAVGRRFFLSTLAGAPDSDAMAPEFVYEQHFGNTAGVYVGESGMRRWVEAFYEIWDEASGDVRSFRHETDRFCAEFSVLVRGGQTGIEVELKGFTVMVFDDDGRLTRMDNFNEVDEAERALRGSRPGT